MLIKLSREKNIKAIGYFQLKIVATTKIHLDLQFELNHLDKLPLE